MSVITVKKSYDDVHARLSARADLRVVVVGCDKCAKTGLDSLGPGVKSELACLACGDCQFDQGGCRRLAIVEEQARRLSRSYPRTAA